MENAGGDVGDDDTTTRANRRTWDAWSPGYQRKHGPLLSGSRAAAWGLWRRPEAELRVLDDVADRDVLELGCGAARWSAALAGRGARTVGMDISHIQLRHADPAAPGVQLVQGDAQALPFADRSFDVVLSDYGGMSWGDPYRTVPEAARVLRPGGQLAFCTNTPFFAMCWDGAARTLGADLKRPYFGLHTRPVAENATDFVLAYGEWFRLLRAHGLIVESLVEEPPPPGAVTSFGDRSPEWTSRWPLEAIWSVRRTTSARR